MELGTVSTTKSCVSLDALYKCFNVYHQDYYDLKEKHNELLIDPQFFVTSVYSFRISLIGL